VSSPTIPMALQAIPYINGGLSVFPCAKKKPLTEHGCLDASKDLKQITEWWKKWPDAQIGIATGPVSNLVVLDVDGPQGFAWLSGRLLPETREVETQPGNKHFWFKLPAGRTVKNSAGDFAPEVDVRGAGGYVIAPPSIHHETLKPYRFLNKVALAEAPAWLLEPPPKPTNGNGHSGEIGLVIHEGEGRHVEALRLAGGLRARGANAQAILVALQIFSQQYCRPPLEQAWMEKQAKYIETKPTGFRGQPVNLPAEVVVESFSVVAPESVRWLWPGRIPAGKLTLFVGDPGKGKTLAAVDLASRLSCGHAFPDGATCERGASLILSAEDSASDTIRPRLDAASADVSQVYFIKAVKVTLGDGQTGESSFSLERDLIKLEETLKKHPGIKVIILDPLSAYLGTKVNSWRDTEVRALLTPLVEFASRTGVAIIGILHLRKSETDALLRVSGSIAFVAAARVVWGFGEDPDDASQRLMVPVKNNLAPLGNALAYQITSNTDGAPYLLWGKETRSADANEVLGLNSKEKRERASSLSKAKELLEEYLSGGPRPQKEVEEEAEKVGITWRTLRRAKKDLGVLSHKAGMGGGWFWELPKVSNEGDQNASI